ncbi:hypothetical protein V6Z11_D11G189900 [Gossypium hirsutum]
MNGHSHAEYMTHVAHVPIVHFACQHTNFDHQHTYFDSHSSLGHKMFFDFSEKEPHTVLHHVAQTTPNQTSQHQTEPLGKRSKASQTRYSSLGLSHDGNGSSTSEPLDRIDYRFGIEREIEKFCHGHEQAYDHYDCSLQQTTHL